MPRVVLTLGRSRSREYARARELALSYGGTTAGPNGSLVSSADAADEAALAAIARVLEVCHAWKGTSIAIDGTDFPPKVARNMLRCLHAKKNAPVEDQRWHCHSPRYASDLSLPLLFGAPCRFAEHPPVLFWADYVHVRDGIERTDRGRMIRAYEALSATSKCRWCPGFSTAEMSAFIGRLPDDHSTWRSSSEDMVDLAEPVARVCRRMALLDASTVERLDELIRKLEQLATSSLQQLLEAVSDEELADVAHVFNLPEFAGIRSVASWPDSKRRAAAAAGEALVAAFQKAGDASSK